jgi:flagellar biosynthesis/type III secretory pathway protein FliH
MSAVLQQDQQFRFPTLQRKDGSVTVQQLSEQFYQQGFQAGVAATEQDAYQRGVTEGQQQLQDFWQKELEKQQNELAQKQQRALDFLTEQFNQQLQHKEQQLGQELLLLVQQLASTVLQTELVLQPSLLQLAIDQLLPQLGATDPLQSIQLSQADAPLFNGIRHIQQIPLQFDAALPSGRVQFNGRQQLHQLDFQQRLAQAMLPVRRQLLGDDA